MSKTLPEPSHSTRDCKYRLLFLPKKRRKVSFGQVRRELEIAKQR